MTGDTERRVCRECGETFGWTDRQAQWMRRRLENVGAVYSPPLRCPDARPEQ